MFNRWHSVSVKAHEQRQRLIFCFLFNLTLTWHFYQGLSMGRTAHTWPACVTCLKHVCPSETCPSETSQMCLSDSCLSETCQSIGYILPQHPMMIPAVQIERPQHIPSWDKFDFHSKIYVFSLPPPRLLMIFKSGFSLSASIYSNDLQLS